MPEDIIGTVKRPAMIWRWLAFAAFACCPPRSTPAGIGGDAGKGIVEYCRDVARKRAEAAARDQTGKITPEMARRALEDSVWINKLALEDPATRQILDPPGMAWRVADVATQRDAVAAVATLKDEAAEGAGTIEGEEGLLAGCEVKVGGEILKRVCKRLLEKVTDKRMSLSSLLEDANGVIPDALALCLTKATAQRILGKIDACAGEIAERAIEKAMDQGKETEDGIDASADTKGKDRLLLIVHALQEGGA